MKINNISKCCKPRRVSNFTGNELTETQKQKRFKHYEQMSDDVLMTRSINKAHQTVQNSGKMHLLKAIPAITTTLIGTSLALTRPGKLSAKAATGLGFLVASEAIKNGFNNISEKLDKKYKNEPKNSENQEKEATARVLGFLGTAAAAAVGIVALAKGMDKIKNKNFIKVKDFVKSEINTLSKELNSSKLGKFVDEKITPFLEKHQTAKFAAELAPCAFLLAGVNGEEALSKSISKDFKKEANKNFIKGKLIQDIAKKEFDSIDAQEV